MDGFKRAFMTWHFLLVELVAQELFLKGKINYKAILPRSSAFADFQKIFQTGNPQAKSYADPVGWISETRAAGGAALEGAAARNRHETPRQERLRQGNRARAG